MGRKSWESSIILIDTDIFIDGLRGLPEAVDYFKKNNPSEIFFSAVTETELFSGESCNDPVKSENLSHFLALYTKIPMRNPIAETAGKFKRVYGLQIPDAIIASTAFHTSTILITRNLKDFEKVTEIEVKSPY